MNNIYAVNAESISYANTRRGVAARYTVLRNGVPVADVDDQPEAIVAKVSFRDDKDRAPFLAAARTAGLDLYAPGDAFAISEYARSLAKAAETAWAKSSTINVEKNKGDRHE